MVLKLFFRTFQFIPCSTFYITTEQIHCEYFPPRFLSALHSTFSHHCIFIVQTEQGTYGGKKNIQPTAHCIIHKVLLETIMACNTSDDKATFYQEYGFSPPHHGPQQGLPPPLCLWEPPWRQGCRL